jgi:hypothetical protein
LIENNYLLPDIDDDGNINKSFVMINYLQSSYGAFKIEKDLKILKNSLSSQ